MCKENQEWTTQKWIASIITFIIVGIICLIF